MYMRNDCYHFGKVSNYTISQTKCDYGGDISQAQSEDIFQIDSIRRATKVGLTAVFGNGGFFLEAGAFPSIFKMKQALYVASRDGVIEGYAVMGLPIASSTQQQAIVTEWGGDTKVVYEIFQNILAQGLMKEIGLTIPWHEKFCEELNQHPMRIKGILERFILSMPQDCWSNCCLIYMRKIFKLHKVLQLKRWKTIM